MSIPYIGYFLFNTLLFNSNIIFKRKILLLMSTILKTIFLGSCVFITTMNISWAQLPADVQSTVEKNFPIPVQKSPNASSIERYGNYDVNLYTGLPNISIPLHTVKSGPIEFPVSLSYHSSGIKYTDQASWVGLGWSLIAGGQITRQIKNLPDETAFLKSNQDPNDYNLFRIQ